MSVERLKLSANNLKGQYPGPAEGGCLNELGF